MLRHMSVLFDKVLDIFKTSDDALLARSTSALLLRLRKFIKLVAYFVEAKELAVRAVKFKKERGRLPSVSAAERSFHGHGFRQVARLVHIGALLEGRVVGQELHR
jgi:hypothetical protein